MVCYPATPHVRIRAGAARKGRPYRYSGGIMVMPQIMVQCAGPYAQDLQGGDDPYRYFNW